MTAKRNSAFTNTSLSQKLCVHGKGRVEREVEQKKEKVKKKKKKTKKKKTKKKKSK